MTVVSTDIATILSTDRGANFYRGDLHIHSVVGSHDVSDKTATPEAIVATAAQEGLSIIAIADHNDISAIPAAFAAATTAGILLVPAVELSTAHGHLLCYFPTVEALSRFYWSLNLSGQGTPNSHCNTAVVDCLDKVKAEGGFALLAHIDGGKGLETVLAGNPPHKKSILCHPALLGIELTQVGSDISYSDNDPDADRKTLGKERIKSLKLGQSQFLARVLNSDAHTLASLGRNAKNQKRVTRYKMQSVSFDGLRMALEDADARVRIEDEIPTSIPLVRAINMQGGFLDAQFIHFSPNLNCIIGGRGTGKSTTFEAVRVLAGHDGETDVCDSDVWPERIDLVIEDKAGQTHRLTRHRGGFVENEDNPHEGPVSFPIECYGQGETQAISQKAQNDPAALLEYLDRFIDIEDDLGQESALLDEALVLQGEIEEATRNVERIPQIERDLNLKKSQLDALEKANAKDVIALVRKMEAEKAVRLTIRNDIAKLVEKANHSEIKGHLKSITEAAEPDKLEAGKVEYEAIVASAKAFDQVIAGSEAALKAEVDKLAAGTNTQLATWQGKTQTTLAEIEAKKKALAAQNIQLDMAYINKLTQDEAALKETLRILRTWVPHLKALAKKKADKLTERWAARSRIATKRAAFAQKSTAVLRAVLGDLQVSLKFRESAHSPEAERIIIDAMNWRTSQVPRANILVGELTLPKLLEAIYKNNPKPIQDLKTAEGQVVFNNTDATAIIQRLSEPQHLFRLERAPVVDRPMLTVTKTVEGATKPAVRDFSKLSLGQQQSVLLALMLSVDTDRPLIIDQPEDNLDSEFIYHTLVPVLRRAKERRQVIIVTHNANIAVLGDAEQIVILKSTADQGRIVSRGSIDHPDICAQACKILEGAEEAFRRRARIYGVA